MRQEASLIIAGTLFATGMFAFISGSGHTLEWEEMGLAAGVIGALVTLPSYARLLAGPANGNGARPTIPLFWKCISWLVLFGFWFMAGLAINTAWSWPEPIERIEGVVSGKRTSRGRYSHAYYAEFSTQRGPVEASMPRDIWADVEEGQRFALLVCRGLLGYPYIVTPLDRGPYLDVKRLLGLRDSTSGMRC